MLEEIEGAERKIFVGTFIWKGGEVGRYFVEALTKKTREGAEVCDLRRAGERGRAPFGQTFSGGSTRSTSGRSGDQPTSRTRATSSGTTAA